MSDSIKSAMLDAFSGISSPIPSTEKRRIKITCTPGTRTASQLMEEYPTLSRSAAFRMAKTGWAMLNYQVREVNPDMSIVTSEMIESFGRYANHIYSSSFRGFFWLQDDLVQEGITRILELTGKTTDPNYLMESAKHAMRNYLAKYRAIRFSGTFEPFDEEINTHFHGTYGGDPADRIEDMTFEELRDSRTHTLIPEGVRAWSAM